MRYIFLKNDNNLTAKQATQKQSIETMGLKSWRAMLIREGLNSVLQAAKRKARGYKFDHFRTIAFLITGRLSFNQLNYALPT